MSAYITACRRGCGTRWRWRYASELAAYRGAHVCHPLPYVPKHMKKGTRHA